MWIILKDHLEGKDFLVRSRDCTISNNHAKRLVKLESNKRRREIRKSMPIAFRLYDDDDELYFSGYQTHGPRDDGFEPLDDFGEGYAGCTKIKYRNPKTGKWHLL